jgi:hypothetical protein
MAEEVPAFLRAEIMDNTADPAQKARDGALGCLA